MSPEIALMKEVRAYRHAQHVANGTDRYHVSERQQRKARQFARQITDHKPARKAIAQEITRALAAFGGRISGFEISAQ